MVQIARPTADTFNGHGYTTLAGGGVNLFQQIDESVASDADGIQSPSAPTNDVYVTKFGNLTDPVTSAGYILRYRIKKDLAAGQQIDKIVQIRTGYVDESTLGTLIAEWVHENVSETETTFERTLTGPQADAISNHTSIYYREVTNQVVPFEGTTFFSADAESGTLAPPWATWGIGSAQEGLDPVISTEQAFGGTKSFKCEIPATSVDSCSSALMQNTPTTRMDPAKPHFMSGFYSFRMFIASGYDVAQNWQMVLGWMTGVSGATSPISHIELSKWNGVLQLRYVLKNATGGLYTAPEIEGYQNESNGYYHQTAQSPNGITPFPKNQWVHVCAYYEMAETNGHVILWQDGVKVMDLTAPTMNTFGGHSVDPLGNAAGDMNLQFGIYGGPEPGAARVAYFDDFKVTNYQVLP